METWYEYRGVWAAHPWVLVVAIVAVVLIVGGVVGTISAGPLAFLFIPGLAMLYGHHLIVQKKAA